MNGGASLFDKSPLIAQLDPGAIEVGERIGFYHEDKAIALGRLMATDGQRDPIKVIAQQGDKPWRLVTGMHRLKGAEAEGIKVWAIEVEGGPEDLADLEASENLHRRPLGPIERAKFTAALVQAAQERLAREHGDVSQHQLAIKARWDRVKHQEETAEGALRDETEDTCATMSHVYGWEESVAEALDMSRRTIHRDLSLYRLLIEPFPELIEALAKHPVVGENASQLKEIARIKDQAKRGDVIAQLIDNPEISVDDARILAGVPKTGAAEATPVAHQKHFDAITGGWARLSLAHQREFLPKISSLLTEDMKRSLRDQLNEELGE